MNNRPKSADCLSRTSVPIPDEPPRHHNLPPSYVKNDISRAHFYLRNSNITKVNSVLPWAVSNRGMFQPIYFFRIVENITKMRHYETL